MTREALLAELTRCRVDLRAASVELERAKEAPRAPYNNNTDTDPVDKSKGKAVRG